jgi:outer membrane protein, heavy metal efflux system
MPRVAIFLLVAGMGCAPGLFGADTPRVPRPLVEISFQPLNSEKATSANSPLPELPISYSLPFFWNLALSYHPELRQFGAEVEATRGKMIQAGKYPNPRILYDQEELGASAAPAGNIRLQVSQEIITGGKRSLDQAISGRSLDEATIRLEGKRFEILTRIRRAFYEYVGWIETARVGDQAVESLQKSVEITRQLVEQVKTRPVTDLLRLESLLEEAKINQARSRINLQGSWRQLAVEVGVPDLPSPAKLDMFREPLSLDSEDQVVRRVLNVHTELQQAEIQAQQARLEIRRAKAETIPNIQVGGGFTWNFVERASGAIVSLESSLPLWDRKQGRIYEAQARLAQSLAFKASVENRLRREAAGAFASYQAAKVQVECLQDQVLPKQQESLVLVRRGYQAGAPQIAFADVLLAEATVNETKLKLAGSKRELWRALADLQGLMHLDIGGSIGEAKFQTPADPSKPVK